MFASNSGTNTAADSRPAVTLLWQTEGPHSGGFHTHLPGSFTQSQLAHADEAD